MPRLTEDQVKVGILHSNGDVRLAAVEYFTKTPSPNSTVMPIVIEALERFGREDAFPHLPSLSVLPQTEATIRWAMQELQARPGSDDDAFDEDEFEDANYLGRISRLLCMADPRLVAPFQAEILALPNFLDEHRERLEHRVALLTWDADALWRELEVICEEGKNEFHVGEMRWDEGVDIVKQIARLGGSNFDRMMQAVTERLDQLDDNPQKWMEPLMIRLAGELRHAPAVPALIARMRLDGELVNEECMQALGKIGSDEVLREVHRDYLNADWSFRLYAGGVLERIHSDLAVELLLDLLAKEEEPDQQTMLAQYLLGQFSTEGNQAVRQLLLDDPEQWGELCEDLVTACTLMGQEMPELDQWRKEVEKERREQDARLDWRNSAPPEPKPASRKIPIMHTKKKIGRNDPCPCGSGQKFKRCCMKKQTAV